MHEATIGYIGKVNRKIYTNFYFNFVINKFKIISSMMLLLFSTIRRCCFRCDSYDAQFRTIFAHEMFA